jgi:hypothetical protein
MKFLINYILQNHIDTKHNKEVKKVKKFIVMMFCMSVMALAVSGCAKKAEQPVAEPAAVDSTAAVVDTTQVAQ